MEALGTGMLTMTVGLLGKSGLSVGARGLAVAAVLLPLIYAGARVSGASYNPLVSFALVLLGKMTPSQAMVYTGAQLLGAMGGGFLTKALVSPAGVMDYDPSMTLPASGLPEVLYSFALVLTVLQTAVSKAQSRNSFFGLAISSVVGVGAALGAGMNPAVAGGLFAAAGHSKGLLARLGVPLMATVPAALFFRCTDIDETYTMKRGMMPKIPADFVRNRGPYLTELAGTFLLTSTVGLALATKALPVPVAAGLCMTFLAFGSGYVSGAHVNPAVTLGVYLRNAKKIGSKKLGGYVVMQIVGAVGAGAVVKAALGPGMVAGKFPVPQAGFSSAQVFGTEALFTGLVVSTVLHVGAATGYQGTQLNGLAVSMSLGAGMMVSEMISGGSLNPAAAMGLALSNGATGKQLRQLWMYVIAPLVGAVFGHASMKITSPFDMGKE